MNVRALLGVTVVVLLTTLAATVTPARASGPTDVPLPPGYTDPIEAYGDGAYSSATEKTILERMAGYTGTDGASIADYFSSLSTQQSEYAMGRIGAAAAEAGIEPELAALAGVGAEGAAIPLITVVGGVAVVAVGGYITYKLVTHFLGSDHTTYLSFDRAYLGGSTVLLPNDGGLLQPYLTYKPVTQADCNTSTGNFCKPFGWYYTVRDGHAQWVFNYAMMVNVGSAASPSWSTIGDTVVDTSSGKVGVPKYGGSCVGGAQYCYPYAGYYFWHTWSDMQTYFGGLGQAAELTEQGLEGTLQPLRVRYDGDAYAIGHVLSDTSLGTSNFNCHTTTTNGGPCEVAYITDTDFQRLAPRKTGESDPGGDQIVAPTFTASDPRDGPGRTKVTTELDDPCGRAILRHLIMPESFPYYGCDPTQSDPGVGTTVPLDNPEASSEVTLPDCDGATYIECVGRLRDAGVLGTITRTLGDTGTAGDPLESPGMVQSMDPAPGTTVDPSDTVALQVWTNPDGTDPSVGDGGGTPGVRPGVDTAEETSDCPCPVHTVDLDPLKSMSLGNKFPFGVFGWISATVASLTTTPEAPNWTFPVNFADWTTVDGHHIVNADFTVDLSDGDAFMSVIRNIEAALFAVGTLLWLAFRILGLSAPSGGEGIEGAEAE